MIDTEKDSRKLVERAWLVGICEPGTDDGDAREHLRELAELVSNLDIPIVGEEMVKIKVPHPKYLIGTGKAEAIQAKVKEENIDCLVFDCDLSPSQQRNWEKFTGIVVIDRQEVILDIFAARASSREAVLQVQLARMQYSLPRLTRAWTHLSRQRGGMTGMRGQGEKQIENDRQMVRQRIVALEEELEVVRRQRGTQRKGRDRTGIPHAAIVGYTNAGKSSLLNKLTGAGVLVEDKLFATLDPTTRKVILPNRQGLLLTDTVGFVRKLPHDLVEAFKSTLEEAVLADFLILVLDISSPFVEDHWETTMSVLRELGADDKKMVLVFNKIDLQTDPLVYARINGLFPRRVMISTVTGEGLDSLCASLQQMVETHSRIIRVKLPPARYDLVAFAHANGMVLESACDDLGDTTITMNLDGSLRQRYEPFMIS